VNFEHSISRENEVSIGSLQGEENLSPQTHSSRDSRTTAHPPLLLGSGEPPDGPRRLVDTSFPEELTSKYGKCKRTWSALQLAKEGCTDCKANTHRRQISPKKKKGAKPKLQQTLYQCRIRVFWGLSKKNAPPPTLNPDSPRFAKPPQKWSKYTLRSCKLEIQMRNRLII